jgi:LPS export ABC transporter protein LptC
LNGVYPNKIIKFRDGIKLEFYTKKGALLSTLTAKYGEIDELNGSMFVKDSVRMYNTVKKQELQTEELFWTRKDSVIFTNKLVIVKTPKVMLYGDGIRAKQDFSSYKFIKPKGKFDLD